MLTQILEDKWEIYHVFFFSSSNFENKLKKTHKDLTKDVIYAKVSKVFVFVQIQGILAGLSLKIYSTYMYKKIIMSNPGVDTSK